MRSSQLGGDIAESYHVTLSDNRSIFVKTTSSSSTMFHNEASGLREIKKTGAIKVPEVLFVDDQLLALEMIESSHSRSNSFFSLFGKQMAKLHRNSSKSWGYFEDNYIGKTKQKNLPQLPYDSNMSSGGWFEFYFKNRLMVQYRLMERNGFCTKEVSSLFSRLENNLETILSYAKEPPALLHGDLWGGNYLIGKGGTPYLIDPAIYYGHREADLAMTSLFGGFNPIFYEAYNKEYPLQSGYKKRAFVSALSLDESPKYVWIFILFAGDICFATLSVSILMNTAIGYMR